MISVGSFEELWNIEQDRAENDRQKILGQSSSNSLGIISGLFVINRIMDSHISEKNKLFCCFPSQAEVINITYLSRAIATIIKIDTVMASSFPGYNK